MPDPQTIVLRSLVSPALATSSPWTNTPGSIPASIPHATALDSTPCRGFGLSSHLLGLSDCLRRAQAPQVTSAGYGALSPYVRCIIPCAIEGTYVLT